jgi:putative membrane protein
MPFTRLAACAGLFAFAAAGTLALTRGPQALAQGPQLDDATIVALFDAANTRDIETSSLAAKKAVHPEVRELARTFAHDHRAVRQQGRDLAARLGVKPTPPRDDPGARQHADALRRLRAASGDAFDRAWLEHEVAFHQAVIQAVQQTLAPAITNPELKAFVLKTAPAFQGHLAAAEKLAQKYGATATARTSP